MIDIAPPVAILLPVILPTTDNPLVATQIFAVLLYVSLAYSVPAGPTPIPPPSAALAVAALLAILINKSLVVSVVESIVVVVPCTCKLPATITNPVIPAAAGSNVNVDPELLIVLPTSEIPPPTTLAAVTAPLTLNAPNVPTLVILG